jgi:membrane dipeptidase
MKKIIFDAHQDVLTHEQDNNKTIIQTGFEILAKSAIKMAVSSVFLEPDKIVGLNNKQKTKIIENQIRDYLTIIKNNEKLMLIKNKQDLSKLMQSDLTGILIHIEGVDFIDENNVDTIDYFYNLGLRSVGLMWGANNNMGGYFGSKMGLTNLGKKFIRKLNDQNMLVDLAHTNEKTFYDAIKISQKPVMVSHGNCYQLCEDCRNFKNKQLELLAQKRGVQGIFFSKKYVSKKENVFVKDVVKQFVKSYQISPEGTMIGTDFGGISSGFVKNLNNVNRLSQLIELIEKKLGKEAAEKISYKNFLNFLEKII